MSGHSKWKTIKHQKGAADAKRGQAFTKLGNAITIAVKQGGGTTDPDSNPRLRLALDAARAENMPKENMQRAIDRGAGKGEGGELHEAVYEGFAPHGINVIVEAATDNPQRISSEIKNVFVKNGGSFGQPGSSSYLFKRIGEIFVKKNDKTFDDIFSMALDSGAEDIEETGDEVVVYTSPSDLFRVKDELATKGLEITEAKPSMKPISSITLENKEDYDKVIDFLSTLEQMDDVQEVYSNLQIQ